VSCVITLGSVTLPHNTTASGPRPPRRTLTRRHSIILQPFILKTWAALVLILVLIGPLIPTTEEDDPLKNRVWDFLNSPSVRLSKRAAQVVGSASGYVASIYKTASVRADSYIPKPIQQLVSGGTNSPWTITGASAINNAGWIELKI